MNFPKFQQLVEERTGFRTMESPTASGEYISDSCGDMYNFFLKVGPGAIVEDASYFTTGCGFGTATCSIIVDLVKGKTIDEAIALKPSDVESVLDGYPERKKDYPERALEALHVALDDYRKKVASGELPDHASMPAPKQNGTAAAAELRGGPNAVEADNKILIRLH